MMIFNQSKNKSQIQFLFNFTAPVLLVNSIDL